MTLDEIIDIAYPAALSAYTTLLVPPTGFRLIGKIEGGGDTWGYVALNESTSTGLVAFRGTANFRDWIKDFTALPVNVGWISGCIHEGFSEVYAALHDSLKAMLSSYDEKLLRILFRGRMIFTGHSLGAALATLAACEFSGKGTELVTFAGPRVGTAEFAKTATRLINSHQRVVNHFDIVPHVPGGVVYHHAGEEIAVDGGMEASAVLPDLAYSHRLTTYLVGLEAKRAILHHADVAPITDSSADTVVVAG